MKTDAFTLRDYLAYFFPGVVVLSSFAVYSPEAWASFRELKVELYFILFVGSYLAGLLSVALSDLINQVAVGIFGDAVTSGLLMSKKRYLRQALDDSFRKQLTERLQLVWGKELVDLGRETNLLFLCLRDLQSGSHEGLGYLHRVVSLYNMCLNLIFPFFLLGLAFAARGLFVPAVVALVASLISMRQRFVFRREFARNVYRIWYVKNVRVSPAPDSAGAEETRLT